MSSINHEQFVKQDKWTLLFDALRSTLLDEATRPDPNDPKHGKSHGENRATLLGILADAQNRTYDPNISDADFWGCAKTKPLFAGVNAANISERVGRTGELLSDYHALATVEWQNGGQKFKALMALHDSKEAYFNDLKWPRIVRAAKNMVAAQQKYPDTSLAKIFIPPGTKLNGKSMPAIHKRLASDDGLKLGFVTTLHFMTDLGLPVVKTDRVLSRIVIRLGIQSHYFSKRKKRLLLIPANISAANAMKHGENEGFSYLVQRRLGGISKKTGISMCAIDYLIVKMGMEPDLGEGITRTICADDPLCEICHAQPMCRYGKQVMRKRKGQSKAISVAGSVSISASATLC